MRVLLSYETDRRPRENGDIGNVSFRIHAALAALIVSPAGSPHHQHAQATVALGMEGKDRQASKMPSREID
jgi:hypothetical protein